MFQTILSDMEEYLKPVLSQLNLSELRYMFVYLFIYNTQTQRNSYRALCCNLLLRCSGKNYLPQKFCVCVRERGEETDRQQTDSETLTMEANVAFQFHWLKPQVLNFQKNCWKALSKSSSRLIAEGIPTSALQLDPGFKKGSCHVTKMGDTWTTKLYVQIFTAHQ